MELRVLRYFVTVAREGSITNAAKYLHVTQPTLSRQLKELEEELGKTLFVRSTTRLKLTEEGMLLRKRAEDILDMVDKTRDEFRALDDILGGDIHIGAAETRNVKVIAQVALELRERYPNIRYHLYSGNAADIMERLDRGLLDFCLFVTPMDLSKYNYLTLPARERWGVVMRHDSPLAAKKCVRPADAAALPLILSRQALGNELAAWFGDRFAQLRVVATYNLYFNAAVMVEQGLGSMLCLENLAHTGADSALTFRPLSPRLESGLALAWKKYQVFSRAEEVFLDALHARYAPDAER